MCHHNRLKEPHRNKEVSASRVSGSVGRGKKRGAKWDEGGGEKQGQVTNMFYHDCFPHYCRTHPLTALRAANPHALAESSSAQNARHATTATEGEAAVCPTAADDVAKAPAAPPPPPWWGCWWWG